MASLATTTTDRRPERGFSMVRDARQRGGQHEIQSRAADRRANAHATLSVALEEANRFFDRPGFELVQEGDNRLVITWPKSAGSTGTALSANLRRLMGATVSSQGNTHSARFRNSTRRDVGIVAVHRIIAAVINGADPAFVEIGDINSVRGPTNGQGT